jgi:hypothetical protein
MRRCSPDDSRFCAVQEVQHEGDTTLPRVTPAAFGVFPALHASPLAHVERAQGQLSTPVLPKTVAYTPPVRPRPPFVPPPTTVTSGEAPKLSPDLPQGPAISLRLHLDGGSIKVSLQSGDSPALKAMPPKPTLPGTETVGKHQGTLAAQDGTAGVGGGASYIANPFPEHATGQDASSTARIAMSDLAGGRSGAALEVTGPGMNTITVQSGEAASTAAGRAAGMAWPTDSAFAFMSSAAAPQHPIGPAPDMGDATDLVMSHCHSFSAPASEAPNGTIADVAGNMAAWQSSTDHLAAAATPAGRAAGSEAHSAGRAVASPPGAIRNTKNVEKELGAESSPACCDRMDVAGIAVIPGALTTVPGDGAVAVQDAPAVAAVTDAPSTAHDAVPNPATGTTVGHVRTDAGGDERMRGAGEVCDAAHWMGSLQSGCDLAVHAEAAHACLFAGSMIAGGVGCVCADCNRLPR